MLRTGPARGGVLVELMTTATVIALLAATATPQLVHWLDHQRAQQAADLLAASIRTAAAMASAWRAEIMLVPASAPAQPPAPAAGWQIVAGSGRDATVLQAVRSPHRCVRIAMGTHAAADGPALRLAPVGYSRSRRGGFVAVTFTVRCGKARRQVRLGAHGAIRICVPGKDRDCNEATLAAAR
ncbi:Tfp pilus assembly protein FimT/FimU [Cupriavidus sp. AU9028]|uniref:pilus assembly FimT family protein n=1 Tax=Cupriavidus sp. AU9028 TaxID=2871157 RepID=UPI001C951940|nr:pilus assembly protein [Cupriavidus sp. AU9028]MBY4898162.1 pilus assembly protein [Cupriavidus sp. AU9028]